MKSIEVGNKPVQTFPGDGENIFDQLCYILSDNFFQLRSGDF